MGDIRNNIANNITIYRKKLGLTQSQLAAKIGVKTTSVSSWERGANSPDIETLYSICKLFNISLDEIYGVNTEQGFLSFKYNEQFNEETDCRLLESNSMKRAEILRKLMAEKNMKVADIVKVTGIAYSTVKSLLENGIEKTSYVNVCKICEALGITTDELEKMVHEQESYIGKEPEFDKVELLIARNGKKMSKDQKLRLIQLLSELD